MAGFVYIVQEGEWLSKIAAKFGFTDFHEIYDHDQNAHFRELRPNPNVIKKGDRLWIPTEHVAVLEPPQGSATEVTLKVEPAPMERVKMTLRDASGQTMASEAYTLRIGAFEKQGTTDGDGKLDEEVDPTLLQISEGQIEIQDRTMQVRLGHLDPVRSVTGIQQRLANLGFLLGEVTGDVDEPTVRAIKKFQKAQDIPVDGVASQSFCEKLDEVYGE
jgi:N-acetylmuramoyl-L-alanine amidase